ncbi:MAG: protease inhibitor I42 family protein [Gammaproteobacteria bacterium]|jgi:inhibitor of cysteine peptidase
MMKKLLSIIVFLSIICIPPCHAASNKMKNYLITKENPTLTLTLPSNPTTGYSWFLIAYNKALLTLVSHKYTQSSVAKNGKQSIGAGGYETWQFKATQNALIAPQITYIKLAYVRPWEIKANSLPKNLKTTMIYVVIKP